MAMHWQSDQIHNHPREMSEQEYQQRMKAGFFYGIWPDGQMKALHYIEHYFNPRMDIVEDTYVPPEGYDCKNTDWDRNMREGELIALKYRAYLLFADIVRRLRYGEPLPRADTYLY